MQSHHLHLDPAEAPHPLAIRWLFVWRIASVAALGGLLFGYDWVVIGGARQFYEIYFHLTSSALVAWANSCALLGCLMGSLAAGPIAQRFGRRPVLLLAAILFAVSSVLTGWSYTLASFVFWRIAGGIAIGLSSNISPLYIAEISPSRVRGRLVSLNQFAIVVGILAAQIVNWRIAQWPLVADLSASWNVQSGWRWMFTAVAIPSLIFTGAAIFLPESPRWLLMKGRAHQAERILARIGGDAYAHAEAGSVLTSLAQESLQRSSIRDLWAPGVRRILLIGIALAVLQQWTGINILFNYAGDVFRGAHSGTSDLFLNIVLTGVINLVFTVVSMSVVDRIGRRLLMIWGCLGIATAHALCALAYFTGARPGIVLACALLAIACYATTLAPVTWVLIAEIFPNRVRSEAIAIAVSALWIASFLLTYTFPFLRDLVGMGITFLGYGFICVLGCLLSLRYIQETSGRSLEEIQQDTLRT